MKRLLILISLLCLACSGTTLVATSVNTPAFSKSEVTSTVQPSTTPAPTASQTPTNTPLPPTSTPLPPLINIQNAVQVDKLDEMDSAALRKVVFSPDGSLFATASGNDTDFGIKIWQTRGKQIQSITGFSGIVWDVAFSPNGEWVASAADDQNGQRLRIWNVSDGRLLVSLDGPGAANCVTFSPDGTQLAVGGMSGGWPLGVVWVYDTTSWKMVQALNATGQNVEAVAFTKDSKHLVGSGTDGTLRVWTVGKGTEQFRRSQGSQMNRLALSPDGSLMASADCTKTGTNGCTQGGVTIWRTSNWSIIQQFNDLAEGMVFSPDGSLFITGAGTNDPVIRFRQVNDWKVIKTLPGPVVSVAFSPDSRLLVTASWDKIITWGLR